MKPPRLIDVIAPTNLFDAWFKVRENQGCAGVDGVTIEAFERSFSAHLDALHNEVLHGTYRPLPLLRVEMDKKTGGKRPLSIPAVRDRVLHTAVAQVLTPVFEAEFEACSYAYRKGHSVDQAVRRVVRLRDEGYRWVVDADIFRFFDEVDHDLLMKAIEKLVTDGDILALIRQWLKADVVDGDRRFRLRKGLAQGSPLSPLLANLFLDRLDEMFIDRHFRLVRFADDFLVLCKSRSRAEDALEITEQVLEELRLKINEDKTQVVDFNRGFRFLGVEFIRSLAFKSKYPPIVATESTQEPPDQPEPADASLQHQPGQPLNEMALAFAEAGVSAADFPPRQAHPVECDLAPDATDAEDAPARYDPRLRTLYLLKHGTVLGKASERLVVRREGTIVKEIPAIKVDQIMVFGNVQLTTQVMRFCLQEQIPVFLLSGTGRYYGVVDSFDTDPVLLHRDQFLRADDPAFCLDLARAFVRGKLTNSRVILCRQARKRDAPAFRRTQEALKSVIRQLDGAKTLDQLRGFEGNAARLYFAAIAQTLDPCWGFHKRVRQPPTDPVNAMLSYGYTLLFYNIYSFLRAWGLNPHVGYLHPMRAGHPALVSDMIEEFRAIVVDAVVLKLALNRRLSPEDFDRPDAGDGACLLNNEARSVFIRSLENKLNAPIRHPVSRLRLDYRRCIEHQVRQLSAVIRGREARYQPMVIR